MTIERQKLFGDDIQVAAGAAGMDLRPSLGDIALAQGNDNIIQALTMRLLVRKGELTRLGWPDYGSRLYQLIGEPNNTRTHVKLMAFARSAVERDPRVAEVLKVTIEVLPGDRNVVRLFLDIQLIDEHNPLNLVIDVNLAEPSL